MRHVMRTHAKELVELLFFKPCVELGHALSWTPTPLHYVRRRACAPCCTQGKGEDPEAARALHMATFSLDKMAAGGMYDHIGGGFHRYRCVCARLEGLLWNLGMPHTLFSHLTFAPPPPAYCLLAVWMSSGTFLM